MNIRTTLFTLAIITGLLSGSIQAHGGKPCTPACQSNPAAAQALNQAGSFFTTPQGFIISLLIIGPLATWWNEVGANAIKDWKKRYWDKQHPKTKAHDHSVCMDHGCEAH
jgi:hypothetical protein